PDGRWLATGDFDGGVRIWNVNEKRLAAQNSSGGAVLAMAFVGVGGDLVVAAAEEGAEEPEVCVYQSHGEGCSWG
ncbi:MAG: hypothetical protein ABIF09_09745, partial [Gemmatimonadota bacterium]